jgi:hypothetical protein
VPIGRDDALLDPQLNSLPVHLTPLEKTHPHEQLSTVLRGYLCRKRNNCRGTWPRAADTQIERGKGTKPRFHRRATFEIDRLSGGQVRAQRRTFAPMSLRRGMYIISPGGSWDMRPLR